ncbi:MAG: sulfatase [Candidatus Eisenbacteria bacterium]
MTDVRCARRFNSMVVLAAAALLVLATVSCGRRDSVATGARHVVVISIDTARADHFGFMGSPDASTPRLDAFAAEAVVFEDYMTVVPTTLASHTTLLTGRYPHHHGTARNGFMVNRDNETLAEILSGEGFHCAGFAGSFALDERFDFAQGFDHYDQDFDVLVGETGADQNQRLAEDVTDAALEYLDGLSASDRLLLFLHYFDPHRPYTAPWPFETLHDPRGREGLLPISELLRATATSRDRIEAEARRHAMQYASEISYTDEHVGRLLEGLRARGILDDALVVITTDHGESMWEHGEEFDHGTGVYQSTMHALCVFRLPGGESGGTRSSRPAASVDVLPTILTFLGLKTPGGVDGVTLRLGEDDAGNAERARFGQATKPWRDVETDPGWANMLKARCVRLGRYKYVQTPYLGTEELYDVVSDPREVLNLLADDAVGSVSRPEYASVVSSLRPRLEQWAASAAPLPTWFESSQQEETIERLKSLGYLR